MNAETAYKMLQPLGLSDKEKKLLAAMLNGAGVAPKRKRNGISVTWAKHDFMNRMLKRKR